MRVRDILKATLQRPVAFHAIFARICNSATAGLMLSQAWYWSDRTTEPEGWFYKKAAEWEAEIFLGRHELDTARRILKDRGFLQEALRGVPPIMHYRVDVDAVSFAIAQFAGKRQIDLQESGNSAGRNAANCDAGMRQNIKGTEITSETTTYIKPGTAGAAPSSPSLFPSEPKGKSKITVRDVRFQPIVDSIRLCWPDGVPWAFSADDGAAVKRMLAKRPERDGWTAEKLTECVGFRFMSEGVNVSESVKAWVGAVTDYAAGPLDRYGKAVCTSDRDRERLCGMARALVGLPALKPGKPGKVVEMPRRQEYIASLNANGTLPDRIRMAAEKWVSLRVYLENRINKHSFDTWLKPAKPVVLTQEGFLVMEVPTDEFAIVGQKYADVMESWMKEQGDDVVMVLWKAFAESSQG